MAEIQSVVRRARIRAREAAAFDMAPGQRISVVDLAGAQGADCFAIGRDGHVSCTRTTRSRNRRLFPRVGEAIFDDAGLPLLTLLIDRSPGPHGLLVPPCDPTMYRLRGGGHAHASCHDNLHRAVAGAGIALGRTPPSICLFQNIAVGEDGAIAIGVNRSAANDTISFRAERDLLFVVSACPNDIFKRPPLQPTDLEVVVEFADPAADRVGPPA